MTSRGRKCSTNCEIMLHNTFENLIVLSSEIWSLKHKCKYGHKLNLSQSLKRHYTFLIPPFNSCVKTSFLLQLAQCCGSVLITYFLFGRPQVKIRTRRQYSYVMSITLVSSGSPHINRWGKTVDRLCHLQLITKNLQNIK